MTEMVRVLGDNFEPRQVGTRAFGRAVPGIEVRVVDEHRDVADGQPGRDVGAPFGPHSASRFLFGLSQG